MKQDRFSRHHIRPRSRKGGNDKNIVTLPENFHRAWHTLTHNLTVDESILFIRMVMQPDKIWTVEDLNQLRRKIKGGVL